MNLFQRRPGISLIIAIIFISALMLVDAGLAQNILNGIRNTANWRLSKHTEDAATSAQNLALLWVGRHGAGANSDDDAGSSGAGSRDALLGMLNKMLAEDLGFTQCADGSCTAFTVVGRSTAQVRFDAKNVSYYSVPAAYLSNSDDPNSEIKGTGSAAETCISPGDANDPCYWNRMAVGETTEIPLYYEDSEGIVIKPNFGTGDFILRVRTPCIEPEDGEPAPDPMTCDRVELYPMVSTNPTNPYGNTKDDPVLMQWLMYDEENGQDTLIANDARDSQYDSRYQKMRPVLRSDDYEKNNTEISAGRINDAASRLEPGLTDFIILEKNHLGEDIYLQNYGDLADATISTFLSVPERSRLRIHIVEQLLRYPENSSEQSYRLPPILYNDKSLYVPYLEYQLLTSDPVADTKSFITGFAKLGDFGNEFRKVWKRPVPAGGFTLEQF